MGQTKQYIALRYAQAFLNVYGAKLTEQNYEALEHIAHDLEDQKRVLFFFGLSMIPDTVKYDALDLLCKPYACGPQFKRLLVVLLASQRMYLLPFILKAIIKGYRELHAYTTGTLASSHPLTDEQKKILHHLFEKKIGTTLMLEYSVVPELIAGIRFQTDELVWEYSVDKQLRDIERSLSDKGHA